MSYNRYADTLAETCRQTDRAVAEKWTEERPTKSRGKNQQTDKEVPDKWTEEMMTNQPKKDWPKEWREPAGKIVKSGRNGKNRPGNYENRLRMYHRGYFH